MNTVTIAKDFHWEMGHRLPFHDAGCRNIHGHSYRMRVVLEGEVDDQGMVMDYYDLKTLVQPLVDMLDHSFACDQGDDLMKDFLRGTDLKVNYFPFYTTAENFARWVASQLSEKLINQTRYRTLTVRLHETERTYAEVTVNLHSR
jgi:6-pyruvoyltetrahydropterin/6-carboxytetrahydropterin synthase